MFRRDLLARLGSEFRSVSSLSRELGLRKAEVEEDLRHVIRSARAAGASVDVLPASCRQCGFTFDQQRLTKPGRCPQCRGTRLLEAQVRIVAAQGSGT